MSCLLYTPLPQLIMAIVTADTLFISDSELFIHFFTIIWIGRDFCNIRKHIILNKLIYQCAHTGRTFGFAFILASMINFVKIPF